MTVMRYDIGFGITGVYGRLEYLYALFGKFARFSLLISSSVLPENMEPQMTSILPLRLVSCI